MRFVQELFLSHPCPFFLKGNLKKKNEKISSWSVAFVASIMVINISEST